MQPRSDNISSSEKEWYLRADSKGTRDYRTGFSIDGAGFFAEGTDLYRYDLVEDTWTLVSDKGPSGGSHIISFVINGRAYIGILQSEGYQMYEYDPAYQ